MTEPSIGLGYRRGLSESFLQGTAELDCVEVLVEHFMPLSQARLRELERLADRFEVVLHGVSLSVGSAAPPSDDYYAQVRAIGDVVGVGFLGEHLSVSRSGGFDIWHLAPVWRSEASLEQCRISIERFRDRTGLDLVLENITESVSYGPQPFGPAEFLAAVCDAADCEILFDVTNWDINVRNRVPGYSSEDIEIIAQLSWRQMHVAGSLIEPGGHIVDSHSEPLTSADIETLSGALSRQVPPFIVIERDANLNDFEELVGDVEKVRTALPV